MKPSTAYVHLSLCDSKIHFFLVLFNFCQTGFEDICKTKFRVTGFQKRMKSTDLA